MSFVCHSYVIHISPVRHSYVPYVTRMYSYVIRMSLVCHLYVTRMYSYVTRVSLVCARMLPVCHPYVTRMYSYVIRMSLVCGFTMNHIQRQRTGRINLNYLNNW